MSLSQDINAIPRLFGDAVEQLGKLVENEAQLAKAEISQKVSQAATGAAFVAGAAILCIPVLVLLLIALALWLTQQGWSPVTAHLLAAGAGAIVCAVLAMVGRSYLSAEQLKPKVFIQQVERDVATAKDMVR